MRSVSTVQQVTLHQKLVARAASSAHAVSFRIRAGQAPAFHATQDHFRTGRLSQSASTAQLVSHLKTAVSNAPPAVRASLVWGVKIAPWGLLEQEKTIQPNANDATPVLQPQHQAPPAAAGAN
jgi:hypothetical protein